MRIIKEVELGVRRVPGTSLKITLGEVIYTPPEGEAVIRDKLPNIEQFIHADE